MDKALYPKASCPRPLYFQSFQYASFFLFLHCNTVGHNFMMLSKCFSHPFKYTKKTTASKAVATAYYLQNEMSSEEGCPYE